MIPTQTAPTGPSHSWWRSHIDRLKYFFPPRLDVCFIVSVLLIIVIRGWFGGLFRSFELDETGLLWAISGGPGDIISRATHFPQSFAFCFISFIAEHLPGPSEIAVRMPSLLASLINLGILYHLARYVLDPRGALVTLLFWVLSPEVSHAAVSARPYAIGLTMVVGSTWALLRWLESPTIYRYLCYCTLAALPFYFSYFWVLLLLPHFAYVFYIQCSKREISLRQLLLAPVLILILWTPLLPAFWSAHQTQQLHGGFAVIFLSSLFGSVFPLYYSTGLLSALLLNALKKSNASLQDAKFGKEFLLVSIWAIAPAVALFTATKLTHHTLFEPKYLLVTSPAVALFFEIMLDRYVRSRAIQFCAVVIVTAGMLGAVIPWKQILYINTLPATEDWRGASRFTSSFLKQHAMPVLFTSVFYEGAKFPFPVSKLDRDCLLAPLMEYPIGVAPILVPPELHPWNNVYSTAVLSQLTGQNEFLLYTSDNIETVFHQDHGIPWMHYMLAKDFQWETVYKGGAVKVLRFSRRQ